MKKVFALLFITALISCQEEITPIVKLHEDPVENPNGPDPDPEPEPENCELPTVPMVAGKYANCIPQLSTASFDIVTWNIEQFPKSGNTISMLAEIIPTLNADIIGVQEIGSAANFNTLVAALPGWAGVVSGGSLKTGYLYKTAEVTVSAVTYPLVDSDPFPRSPMFITATHTPTGQEVTLINLHLKCCDDGNSIPRRRDASDKLKTYIDANLSTKAVVMLGDYNEDITQPEGNNVFKNFVDDDANYEFADMTIAQCNSAYWSYPSWPSQLDHMLITNELFSKVKDVRVLRLNECEGGYYNTISDHRPVLLQLQ